MAQAHKKVPSNKKVQIREQKKELIFKNRMLLASCDPRHWHVYCV